MRPEPKTCETRTAEARRDPRSAHQLITLALTHWDDGEAREAISVLQFRANQEVFDAARRLCTSACAQERELGARTLGQLGVPVRAFPDECARVLLAMLERETNENVLRDICIALGYLGEPVSVAFLAQLKDHPSDKVRFGVAFGLMNFTDDLAIRTLIELSTDPDEIVRDWATSGLGSSGIDTPELRAALFQRLADTDEVTRGEALVGMALRKDPSVIEPLIQELTRYPEAEYGWYSLEAAETLGDSRLLPALESLKQRMGTEKFDEAIRCCSQ